MVSYAGHRIKANASESSASKVTLVAKNSLVSLFKLGSRSYFVKTNKGLSKKVGSNSGVIALPSGLLVIDTHLSSEVEKQVVNFLVKNLKTPVKYYANTHSHNDHIGGNSFHRDQARKLTLSSPPPKEFSDIEFVNLKSAHSAQDFVILDNKDRVAFMGDIFVNGYIGYLGESHPQVWISGLRKLLKRPLEFFVPGHGPLGTKADVLSYAKYLSDFRTSTISHFRRYKSEKNYALPKEYHSLGAKFFLERNVRRAFELWKNGAL